MQGYLRKLVDHLKWADAAALRALSADPGSDSRGLTIYSHILGAEAVWLARIAGRTPDVAIWPVLSLSDAAKLAERNAAELDALVESISANELEKEIQYRNSAGLEFRSKLEDILLHVCLHGAYHRGQVAQVIRQGGGEPAPTDYIAFVRGAAAARTAPPAQVTQPR